MHLDQVESQAGVLQPGVTQTAALSETGGSGTGTIQFTPVGAIFSLFHALNDPRLGVQGGEGNGIEFDFGSIVLENAEAIANGVTFCFANTLGVSGANPIRILQLTALREIIKETLVTNPAFQACSAVTLEPTARIVFVTLAAGAVIDILAPLIFLTLVFRPRAVSGRVSAAGKLHRPRHSCGGADGSPGARAIRPSLPLSCRTGHTEDPFPSRGSNPHSSLGSVAR